MAGIATPSEACSPSNLWHFPLEFWKLSCSGIFLELCGNSRFFNLVNVDSYSNLHARDPSGAGKDAEPCVLFFAMGGVGTEIPKLRRPRPFSWFWAFLILQLAGSNSNSLGVQVSSVQGSTDSVVWAIKDFFLANYLPVCFWSELECIFLEMSFQSDLGVLLSFWKFNPVKNSWPVLRSLRKPALLPISDTFSLSRILKSYHVLGFSENFMRGIRDFLISSTSILIQMYMLEIQAALVKMLRSCMLFLAGVKMLRPVCYSCDGWCRNWNSET